MIFVSYIKKILWIIRGGYQPQKFWDRWSETFMDDPWQVQVHEQHNWIIKKIRSLHPTSILEVGCGFGRNIQFLIQKGVPPKHIAGCDISPHMVQKAETFLNNTSVRLTVCNVTHLPYKTKQFDMVLVHGLLMHVKPDEIEQAISELLRVSRRYIIDVEQNYGGNDYTFVHEYEKRYHDLGGEIVEYKRNKKLGLDFIYVKIRP
jgi:ubiquinone/menaquinone biosynthesis C-methylase UbiE